MEHIMMFNIIILIILLFLFYTKCNIIYIYKKYKNEKYKK